MSDNIHWSVSTVTTLVALLAVVGTASLLSRYVFRSGYGPLPPGPKPRFLIGNALDIPFNQPGKKHWELSKQLGSSITHMYTLGYRIMVLNSREDAEELLDKRAEIYSNRSVIPVLELLGTDWSVSVLPYGETWRTCRRICQQNFKAQTTFKYHPIQFRKVHDLLSGLMDSPERFDGHNKMLSVSIPLTTMYGYDVKSLEDPVIETTDRCIELGAKAASPGGSFVNIFPPFKYVPWTWTQRVAKEVRRLTLEMKRIPLEALARDMAQGKAIPSILGDFMEKKQTIGATPEEEKLMIDIAITVYAGASETTRSTIRTLFYQLLVHPEVQEKAQAELDQVLGSPPRLPTFDDRRSLPYIEAIYREVLRWCPPLPLGLEHCNTEDDWYKGYFIPKGTVLFANIWAINRDEAHYGPDAHEFNPDRFFDENGCLNNDSRIYAYGFGRRVCAGRHISSDTVWLVIASVIAYFNLRKRKDENGNEIEINHEFDEHGFLSHKIPFECDFIPRSKEWRDLIDSTRNKGYQY